ncbi:MAG: dUTP diphosphatase [Clostridia bacterium]
MEKTKINIKRLNKYAKLPTYGSCFAAGADLYACTENKTVLAPGETKIISTGIALEIPTGYAGLIYARSGMASKRGLAPANKVGVIDSDYRGEILIALHNHSANTESVECGERIAQLIITPVLSVDFEEVTNLSATARDTGGFGSTGKE